MYRYILAVAALLVAVGGATQPILDSSAFYSALKQQQSGKYEEAIVNYSKQLTTIPAFYEAYINRGFCFYNLHKRLQAQRDFDSAVIVATDKRAPLYSLANIFFNVEKYDTAFGYYARIVAIDTNEAEAYYKMARCKWLARVKIMVAAKEEDYATDTALNGRLGKDILRYYSKAVYLDSIANWKAYTDRGPNSMEAFQDMNTNYEYYYFRGLYRLNMNDYVNGLKDYEASILIHPTIEAYRFAAGAAKQLGQNEKACDYIQSWAMMVSPEEDIDPFKKHEIADKFCADLGIKKTSADAATYQYFKMIGDENYKAGKFDSAVIAYKKAIEMKSPDLKLYTLIARIYENNMDDAAHLDSAEAVLTRLITNYPANKLLIFNRAEFYRRNNQLDKAIEDYKTGMVADSTDYESISNFALCYDMIKDYANAIQLYTKSISVKPNIIAYVNRGRCYKKINNIDACIADEEAAIKLDATYAQAYLILGNCYLQLNQKAKAASIYQKGLAQSPNNEIKGLLQTQLAKAQ